MKRFLAIVSIIVGLWGIRAVTKSSDELELPKIYQYIQENPQDNESIINYTIESKRKNNIDYSHGTLRNLSETILYEAHKSRQLIMAPPKDNREIWNSLSREEKWEVMKEGLEYETDDFLDKTKEMGTDLYSKLRETKLYNAMRN